MSNPEPDRGLLTLDAETLRQVAQSLDVGIAVVDPEDWTVLFENAKKEYDKLLS